MMKLLAGRSVSRWPRRSTQRGLTGRDGRAEGDDDGLVGAALVLNRYGVMSMSSSSISFASTPCFHS